VMAIGDGSSAELGGVEMEVVTATELKLGNTWKCGDGSSDDKG